MLADLCTPHWVRPACWTANRWADLPSGAGFMRMTSGMVHVSYHDPATLAQTHWLGPRDAEYLTKMTGALNKLHRQSDRRGITLP